MPSVRASCCPLPLATPSGERVNHQSSVTLLCLNYKWGLFSIIKQICHASVGNMMECFPSGGWFSLGLRPRENHPPSGKHSIMLPPLAWHICIRFHKHDYNPYKIDNKQTQDCSSMDIKEVSRLLYKEIKVDGFTSDTLMEFLILHSYF